MVTNVRVGVLRSPCDQLSVTSRFRGGGGPRGGTPCDNGHPPRPWPGPKTYSANVALVTPRAEEGMPRRGERRTVPS
ncbi:hypothetical protein GCM10007079_01580 [Nocardiopsis terrae]|nr:hypothetical protein GCM10007079_01580 [Nocardiopsis terrae]